jgi:hypothetical protein
MPQYASNEGQIFFTTGHKLRYGQVVHLETKTRTAAGVLVLNGNQSVLPACGKHRGLSSNAMSVISERPMKGGSFADAPINQIGVARTAEGEQVRLN